MTRVCKKCGTEKLLNDFAMGKDCSFGRRHTCKVCMNSTHRHRPVYRKAYYEAHKESSLAGNKSRYDILSIEEKRDRNLNKYGWTSEDYTNQYNMQDGCCAICGKKETPLSDGRTGLAVDHSHVTGQVRELLCHGCNLGLGKFCDSPEMLRKAADYLEKWQGIQDGVTIHA
jgi:hypothetical protein